MMYANRALDHEPPTDWDCYSDEGAEGASSSNLALGYPGAGVVRGYMDDPGENNTGAGHRYWLQRPATQTMGNGTVGDANALWVFGADAPVTGPAFTSWPSAGFFPAPLEPGGRWSFTPWDPAYDLSMASVSVTDETGTDVPLVVHPLEVWGSLVFELGDLPDLTGTDDTYTVTVHDIVHGTEVLKHEYSVRLFEPTEPAITALAPPTISGTARVGSTLTAGAPTWSTSGVATSYQWLRNGQPINNATGPERTLISTDVGATITVRATGTKAGFTDGSAVSAPTAKVTKITPVITVLGSSPRVGEVVLAITVVGPAGCATDGNGLGQGGHHAAALPAAADQRQGPVHRQHDQAGFPHLLRRLSGLHPDRQLHQDARPSRSRRRRSRRSRSRAAPPPAGRRSPSR